MSILALTAAIVIAIVAAGIVCQLLGGFGGLIAIALVLGYIYREQSPARPPRPAAVPVRAVAATWADAGRALAAYGANHRELYDILRAKAAESGRTNQKP